MLFSDSQGRPRRLFGGYSPKLYDGHWVEANSTWIERRLEGATIYADCHFHSCSKKLKKVTMITPTPKKCGRKKQGTTKRDNQLPDDVQISNKRIAQIRSRVERPFANAQNKFSSLSQPFFEDDDQLDALVQFSLGIVAYEHD